MSRVRSVRAWGPSTGPTACALAGQRCSLWGWRKGIPGGCLPPLRGASGVRRCPSPGRPSSGAGSRGSASRVSRVQSVRAWGPSTGPTACALAGWRCSLWGWRKGVPGGGAFHCCEGRLVSGAVPSSAARPLERATRVPRPVCPMCGRCGRGDPAPAPQRAPLRAGVARCGGGGRASPGGLLSTVVRGAWCQGMSLPRPPVLWSGQPGSRVPCVPGAVGAGVGTQHRHARIDRTRDTRVAEPRLPAPEDGRPGEGQRLTPGAPHNGGRPPPPGTAPHHPRGTQPPQGMQAKGTVLGPHTHTPAPTARGWRTPTARPMGGQSGEGQRLTSHAPHNGGRHPPRGRPSATPTASALAGRRCSLWGWRKGVPGGGAFHHCEGRLRSGAVPPPTARPLLGGLPGLVGCVRCVWCLCRACRGAWCRSLFLWCSPLRCLGAVLCSPCAFRVPFPVRGVCVVDSVVSP